MKKQILYLIWGCFYILCAGFSHVENPLGLQSAALTVLSLMFFIPPAILLIDALKAGDKKSLTALRWISLISLGLTLVLLIANVFSALGSEILGNILHEVLLLVSVPMICSQFWVLSLFLWACILFITLPKKK